MDELDRKIINSLQGGFPLSDRPYRDVAEGLGTTEDELIQRLQTMLSDGRLSRFGPMYNAQRIGGEVTLCAMSVPSDEFDIAANKVNSFHQVAHNYERDHPLNMWFVLATESAAEISRTIENISSDTGMPVYEFPKLEEYFVNLRFDV